MLALTRVKDVLEVGGTNSVQKTFRSTIPHLSWSDFHASDATGIQENASFLFYKIRHNDLDAPKYALHIDIHGPVELIFADLNGRFLVISSPSIIDHDIQLPELIFRKLKTLLPGIFQGDIERQK
jgi:hypothetical protein